MKSYIPWGILIGVVIGSTWLSAPVHGAAVEKPSICAAFDASPTFASVNAVMQTLIANGNGIDTAARIVVGTVEQSCPQHIALLQAYVDAGVFLYPELAR